MYYLPRTSRGTLGQPAHAKKRTRTLILTHVPAFLETLTAFSTRKKKDSDSSSYPDSRPRNSRDTTAKKKLKPE